MEWRAPQAVRRLREAAGKRHHLGHFFHQCVRGTLGFGEAAGQGPRVAAMSEKIEGHRDVAVARQRHRERLHELLRPGNPWAITTTGPRTPDFAANTVTGVMPTMVRVSVRPDVAARSCHSATAMAASPAMARARPRAMVTRSRPQSFVTTRAKGAGNPPGAIGCGSRTASATKSAGGIGLERKQAAKLVGRQFIDSHGASPPARVALASEGYSRQRIFRILSERLSRLSEKWSG